MMMIFHKDIIWLEGMLYNLYIYIIAFKKMNLNSETMSQDHLKRDLIERSSRVLPAFIGWKIYHQDKDIWELYTSDVAFFAILVFFPDFCMLFSVLLT